MCEIAGAIAPADGSITRETLEGMLEAIAHRGPDGHGIAEFCTAAGQRVLLGHRRLAIIDPEGGKQPMVDAEAGLAITYNGEIYNFRELREELKVYGYAFSVDSDTEVLLRAYQHWGDKVVEKLRGMFAFAIWDAKNQRLYLARDRFGEKPLFIRAAGGGFCEGGYSELAYASVVARHFGTHHHELTVTFDDIVANLPRLVGYRDAPVSEPSDIPIYLLAKEASKTVKMVLTGEGSDEILGGYPKHVYERFAQGYQLLPGYIRNNLIAPLTQSLPYEFRRAKTAVTNLNIEDWRERYVRWFGALNHTEREKLTVLRMHRLADESNRDDGESRGPLPPFDAALDSTTLRRILYFDQTSWLPDNLLERGDRMTMAASIESRVPFLDHELARYVSSLPASCRVKGMKTKWILRQPRRSLIPGAILERPKVGFRVPVNERVQGSLHDYLLEHLKGAGSKTRAYYDAQVLDRMLDDHAGGRFDVFALVNVDLGNPPRWNRDPKTGVEAPLEFGKQLDYRDPARVGDCKYLWEPNRHLHLVTLAQAYALTGDARHGQALRTHLESWFDACPFRMGANWSSSLELGLRLVNWALAWQLIGGVDSPLFAGADGGKFRARWLESVYQHADFISGHLSLHSSANNHLVGEVAGLYTAALAWPHWQAALQWRKTAGEILEREAVLQNAPDGVNREQAVSYQQFELDLLLLPPLAPRANGLDFPAGYVARIEARLIHLPSIIDYGGNVPMFGDADDGYAVRLDPRQDFSRYHSLLATGALMFGRGDFKAKAGTLDDKTRWLFGARAREAFDAIDSANARLPIRREFPDGGYYILGCDFESDDEIRLVADAGPLGYREIAAHGHADALSFTLSTAGEEFLVDPGTFAYHTKTEWRAYFRGTAAHNTLRVDARDQSQPGGNFMWLRKARARCGER